MAAIRKLSEDIINHIAAGEVVERPASILKELVDNSIDAGATRIAISVTDGGVKKVEVADDGTGISAGDLHLAVEPHSTSKISEVDDLGNISTLGFRGEALASIAAVSRVTITTATESERGGHSLKVEGGEKKGAQRQSRDTGTTITVENVFYNVPARRKFLKTPRTEYRKIIETFFPFALIHPDIHFVLKSNGKVIRNLPLIPDASQSTLHPMRLQELFPDLELIEIFYDGQGIVTGGYVAHPTHQRKTTRDRYIFVNGRPIWDSGIAKAASVGMSRFVPDGMKVPFFISVSVPYDQVDVNVHPQKTEVRFANPYRIYSAVQSAVKRAMEDTLGKVDGDLSSRFREGGVRSFGSDEDARGMQVKRTNDQHSWSSLPKYDVERSLAFSKQILEDSDEDCVSVISEESKDAWKSEDRLPQGHPIREDTGGDLRLEADSELYAHQYLKRYIVAQIEDALFIIDQHAAAERIRFEKLLEDYEDKGIETQSLMIPVPVKLAETEVMLVQAHQALFEGLGFEVDTSGDTVTLTAVPALLSTGDHEGVFRSVLSDIQEYEELSSKKSIIEDTYRDSVIATMACHSSVRMNQRLNASEARRIVRDLLKCRNSYSCPHGRPIVWKLTQSEVDRNFNR